MEGKVKDMKVRLKLVQYHLLLEDSKCVVLRCFIPWNSFICKFIYP